MKAEVSPFYFTSRYQMNKFLFLLAALCTIFLFSCKKKVVEERVVSWDYAHNYYLENIRKAMTYLEELSEAGVESPNAKELFAKARTSFKKAEPYASYLNPPVGHRVNGPALPVFKEDNEKVLRPIGLQKIEESIYEGGTDPEIFRTEISITIGLLENLRKNMVKRPLNPQRFFIATHQQLLRIISLGISGFDTPVSYLGIEESKISLGSLVELYQNTFQWLIIEHNPDLDNNFRSQIQAAMDFIDGHKDFETFDRYTFIRDHLNPITRSWVEIRKNSALWDGTSSMPFNFEAQTFFDRDAFNRFYFMPGSAQNPSLAQIELGEKLFFDKNLSSNRSMACATCHVPDMAYADGLAANQDKFGNPLMRNTPTLINSVYQQSFFWDGRSETLLDQISSVFTNKLEFDSRIHEFSDNILQDSTYISLFKEAYGRVPTKNTDVVHAIGSYIATLNAFDSKFDRNIRAEETTFTDSEKRGFNLYMGKALCATCHFIPLTNGTVPPFFKETEKEVIGVPDTSDNLTLDDDYGFYWRFGSPLHKGMFKTPTVRNASVTAPYMHNGVYATLEEVMEFYNKGGGGGMGFDLEYQTLPFDALELTETEQQDIINFMNTLTDTEIGSY